MSRFARLLVSRSNRRRGAGKYSVAIKEYLAAVDELMKGEDVREVEVVV